METLTKPAKLSESNERAIRWYNRDTVQTLDEIRGGADNPLSCSTPDRAEELFGRHIRPLLKGSGMPGLQVMRYVFRGHNT